MKKALLSIAALTLLATQGSAQITIPNTSFGTLAGTTDIAIKAQANSYDQVTGPTHINTPKHSGFTWDLNTIYIPTDTMAAALINYRHVAQTGYSYADSMTENMSLSGNSTFSFPTNILTNITPTGIVQPAQKIIRKVYSLASLPNGTVNDSLVILPSTATYYNPGFSTTPAPRLHMELPLALDSTWSNNYFYSVKACVNYAFGGYVNDTIERKRYIIDQYLVIGYGNLKVRNKTQAWSDYFNVLQTRQNFQQITDSFYIGGVLATNLELAPFGLTQGQDTTMYRDLFFRTGQVTPIVNLQYTDGGRNNVMNTPAGRSLIHAQGLNPSGVNNVAVNDNFAIFPNPVKSGGTLTIDLKDATANGNWSYNMINVTGQKVTEGQLEINGGKTNITLPKLPSGIYYIQATNGQNKIVKAMDIE